MIIRPLYEPQLPQTRWGTLGAPHCGQVLVAGTRSASWLRRLSLRAFEVFRFGTAIGSASPIVRLLPVVIARRRYESCPTFPTSHVGFRALSVFRFAHQLREHSERRIDLFVDAVTLRHSQVHPTV